MLMGPIEYLQLTAPEMDTRIRRRHQAEISELMTLGFDYLGSEGQRFPLTRMLRVFPALVALGAWTQRTPIWITGGAILFGYPILVYRPKPTYVELDALQAKFVAAFEDGVVLASGHKWIQAATTRPTIRHRLRIGLCSRFQWQVVVGGWKGRFGMA